MTSQFSHNVSELLMFSREEASRLLSRSVGPEHILLGILHEKNGITSEFFLQQNIDIESLRNDLVTAIQSDGTFEMVNSTNLSLNEKASNILKLAVLEARLQHTHTVDVPHVLLAILHDQAQTAAKDILLQNNVRYNDMMEYMRPKPNDKPVDGIFMSNDDDTETPDYDGSEDNGRQAQTQTQKQGGGTPVIDNFSIDLTKAASEGKLDPVVGREDEILRVTEILCRRKKNNPILIGEPGVGKSAIVEGLAQMIVDHKTSPVLFNKRLVNLDMTAMVAGTKYRGQFEERIRALLKELEKNPDIILFIDEIHTMVGAGSTPGSMDAANIMKPALARGTIQCIGATTLDEYRNSIEKDGALERRFQKVMVEQTDAADTLVILKNIKKRYEDHHHVAYTDAALEACVKLTDRYVTDRFFPDKAIDALDEVGAHVHLAHATVPPEIISKEQEISEVTEKKQNAVKNQNFELAAGFRDRQTVLEKELSEMRQKWSDGMGEQREEITEMDVARVVSIMTGIPVQRIAEGENERLRTMSAKLKDSVIAQDKAIDKVVKAILRNRVGLKEPNRPIGVFMFLGPTGVGKTHLAKQLAQNMFGSTNSLIRIDMSEYSESFNTSRLVGAPPGYVGYDEGGQLTEQVRRHPYSIILLDEIEKAHQNVFNMLLQVLDEGRLTDGNGRLVDFRNTVIIMTSNAGTRQLKEFGRGVGFMSGDAIGPNLDERDKEYARSIIQKSLSKQFSPEFLNRLDEIITFDQLDLNALKRIVTIELGKLCNRVDSMGYSLDVTENAKEFVATKGYDVQFGARPLKRAIQTYIEDELSELLISDRINPGDMIVCDIDAAGDKLALNNVSNNSVGKEQ